MNPGHEVVGVIVSAGVAVKRWKVGDRVGRGWHGDHCFACDPCLHGNFNVCSTNVITGITVDGGYAEYMVAPWYVLAKVPDGMAPTQAGPLMCAGVTVYNSMRQQHVMPGSLVAVQGIGGLGHLGVQFARAMGYNVVAISSSDDKRELAKELGAHHYINSKSEDPAQALQALGGADMILCTAYDAKSISALTGGIRADGKVIIVGIDAQAKLELSPALLVRTRGTVRGWPSGSPIDSEETLKFAQLMGIKVRTEEYGFDDYQKGYDRMKSGKALFRVVLVNKKK